MKKTTERKIGQKIKRSSDQTIKKKPKLTKSAYYFKCAFCPEVRLGNAALKVHIDSKHLNDLSKFPCEKCYYLAEDTYTLRQHQLFHHQMVSVGQKKMNNPIFKCAFCPEDHQMVSVGQKKMKIPIFKCAFCPEELVDNAALKVHINSKHLYDLSKFPCEKCYYLAENTKTLRQHKLFHQQMVSVGQKWTKIPNN